MGAASTQNASGIVPWLNAIYFPYMFQSNGQLYNFFFNPKAEKVFRKVYRDKYRMEMRWGLCEMRQIFTGMKGKDKPEFTSITQTAGTKNTANGRASCRERVGQYV